MIQEYVKANIVLFSARQIADIFVVWARTFSGCFDSNRFLSLRYF